MSIYTDFKFLRQVSHLLRNYKEIEQFKANFSCPLCGDSKRVKWKARGYAYVYQGKTFFKCQNCGDAKSFGSFLRFLDEPAWREWRKETLTEDPSFTIKPNISKLTSVKKPQYDHIVCITKLPDDHIARVYVASRKIPKFRYNLLFYTANYRTLVEEVFPGKGAKYPDDERLVIPIYNQRHELIGISGRSLNGSKIRYATARSDDHLPFYGLERVDFNKPVFVVEGQLDSLFLPNSIAVCSSNLGMFGRSFPSVHSYILIFDNEPMNAEIIKLMEKARMDNARICVWVNSPFKGKDINEMVQSGGDIRSLVKFILSNAYQGERARLKIVEWRKAI